jgi:uncharacterized membrane protein
VISLIKLILLTFKPNAGLYVELMSIFLAGILMLSIFCTNLIDINSTVESSIQSYIFKFDSGESGDNEPSSSKNPFVVKVNSNVLGESPEIDLRRITDVFMVSVIGKVGLSAMGTVNTPKAKAIVGVSSILSLGAVAGGLRFAGKAYTYLKDILTRSTGSDNSPSSPPSWTANSPLEELSGSENLVMALFSVKLLFVIVLILFTIIIITNLVLIKAKSVNIEKDGYPHYLRFLNKKNNDLIIGSLLDYFLKSGKIIIKALTVIIFFDLISGILLLNKVMYLISLLDF